MPSKIVHTEVGGRKLKLSNLDKILYPSLGITKAEVIQYYLSNASLLLKYVSNRALTVIRYPDGVEGKSFYSKDKPDWTPEWIKSVTIQHDKKRIDYIYAENAAAITWLANLACLELHPMQFEIGSNQQPDQIIFDLDPDEDLDFSDIKDTAEELKNFLEKYDYKPYVKTSGGKGLHVVIPIKSRWGIDEVINCVKSLTKSFIQLNPKLYTLQISKERRKGKILIDIYRNYLSNTTVAPYSLRGRKGAPISMPFYWDDLSKLKSAKEYTLRNYLDYINTKGDAWSDWRDYASDLHDQRIQIAVKGGTIDKRLSDYVDKRDFSSSSEPIPEIIHDRKDQYVIQLHNASNLHYDLRLEDKGVLLSWAIPKGLPFKKGQKRLAIETEIHPIKYLDFEGVIPKGEYGAGQMWIFNQGKIKWLKKDEKSLSFILGGIPNATYKLYRIKNDGQWLIEVGEEINRISIDTPAMPMLAQASKKIPKGKDIKYEVKWDGIRVLIYIENEKVKIVSRNGNDLTEKFPELLDISPFKIEHGVFDGEIVVLDDHGRPLFHEVISRMHSNSAHKNMSNVKPAILYLFDLLSVDGIDIVDQPLSRRREWLETYIRYNNNIRFSKTFVDGDSLFSAIELQGMEGIMAKDQTSKYHTGSRSTNWLKIKCRKSDQCLIIGYTKGKGDRVGLFGSLHLAKASEDSLEYMGKVGTGYNVALLKEIYGKILDIESSQKLIDETIEEEKNTQWIKPVLRCEIKYASLSSNSTYREPVFVRLIE